MIEVESQGKRYNWNDNEYVQVLTNWHQSLEGWVFEKRRANSLEIGNWVIIEERPLDDRAELIKIEKIHSFKLRVG